MDSSKIFAILPQKHQIRIRSDERDQCTFPDAICSCRIYFSCFPLALASIRPRPLVQFFEISLKNSDLKTTHNTLRDCRVHFSDNLSRNSCRWTIQMVCRRCLDRLQRRPNLRVLLEDCADWTLQTGLQLR